MLLDARELISESLFWPGFIVVQFAYYFVIVAVYRAIKSRFDQRTTAS
jgi:hypothetical protein